ncbi:CB068-like protein [Mya arenaria]|uniref:CB068-like protein n=1 Tax=Mya arenaria TaxID=6604 RepID=A0ABY7DIF1_MYAAR|nr:CB068-like protein [Mya arenaria]
MSTSRAQRIDMKHGFMKSIIRNQVDRDSYDKEVKTTKQNTRGRHFGAVNQRSKKPDAAVYVPPSRKDQTNKPQEEQTFYDSADSEQSSSSREENAQSKNTQNVSLPQDNKNNRNKPQSHSESVPTGNKATCESSGKDKANSLASAKSAKAPPVVNNSTLSPHNRMQSPNSQEQQPQMPKQQKQQQPYNTQKQQPQISQQQQQQQPRISQQQQYQYSDDDDDEPKLLFKFEFEDKDGKGIRADVLARRMGCDRGLPPHMVKTLENILQKEIDKRSPPS